MERIQKMQAALKKKKYDAALLINTTIKDPNMLYFTNLGLEHSLLLIQKNGEAIFWVSALEYEQAKKEGIINKVVAYKNPLKEIKKVLKGKKVVAINEQYITIATEKALKKEFKGIRCAPLQDICRNIRMVKEDEEIEYLKKAAAYGDEIFRELIQELKIRRKEFITEKDIVEFIEKEAKKRNTIVSFETIVATGKNAAIPHYTPQNIPLERGFCVLDFGIRYKNYVSDMSRTIFFGIPKEEEKRQYAKVKRANEQAIAALTIGKKIKEIDKISRKEFNYKHGLGHGIGVEIHEAPNISPKSKDKIKENMCFTIEPGMYVPEKFGIRIEDDIWMTKQGPMVLTKSTKELLCFE